MGFLYNDETVSLINVKLTDKGRELLAKGFKDDNIFDVVKFSLGDSDVDYRISTIDGTLVLKPESANGDIKSKIYASGVIPSGTPTVSLTNTTIGMGTYEGGISVGASTSWAPITGNYVEQYIWTNLGPLQDYDFNMVLSVDTTVAEFRTFDTVGTTMVKVRGVTSGAYEILTLNIT